MTARPKGSETVDFRIDSTPCVKNFENYVDSIRKNFKHIDDFLKDPEQYSTEVMARRIRFIEFDNLLRKRVDL